MTRRTRRLTLPITIVLVVAGCASASPSSPSPRSTPSAPPAAARASLAATEDPGATQPTEPATTASSTMSEIARLQAAVARDPSDAGSQRDLGFALLQRVRETADPSLYAPAAAAFDAARTLAPDDGLVLVGIGGLQLGKHEFAEALESGRRAVRMSPNLASARAVVVDALVELGRYDDAEAAAGEMLGVRSDLTTLSRVSYLAELHGKLDVALRALRMAAASPGLAPENVAFAEALQGNLLVYSGDPGGAAEAYRRALVTLPAHAPSLAGQARLAVGAGRLDDAIALFGRAADIVPLPEYVIALGEAQTAAGRADDAGRSFKLARAEIQLFQASGVIVDLDLALFEVDHGDPGKALEFAQAGYDATPTVRAADAMAWALHRLGRDKDAKRRAVEALRLGSRDPLFHYHAGAIEAALGETNEARRHLQLALSTDPGFSATGAMEARRILASLPDR
jgi:tetratricopeptide (TPR) repeat protein